MKNKLILFLITFLSFSTTLFAATDSIVVDTSKVTEREVYNNIKQAISGLSEGLKIGADKVYNVVLKQQIVNSVIFLVFLLLGIIELIIASIILKKAEASTKAIQEDILIVAGIILLVLGAIMFLIGLYNINEIITGFINPEYGAIKDIMNFIHN